MEKRRLIPHYILVAEDDADVRRLNPEVITCDLKDIDWRIIEERNFPAPYK
jgi:hypothetical protein